MSTTLRIVLHSPNILRYPEAAEPVDKNQTAQNVQSDFGSTLSDNDIFFSTNNRETAKFSLFFFLSLSLDLNNLCPLC